MKMLKIKFFSPRYTLIANFSVEKKRLRRSLVEHAAEVVARMVAALEQLRMEDISEEMRSVVTEIHMH